MPVASERFSSKGLGEVVSRIVATRERYKVVGSKISVLSQKMVADVDVFHTSMVDRVFGALDAGFVVDHQSRRGVQRKSNLLQKLLQVDDTCCRLSRSDVFCLS